MPRHAGYLLFLLLSTLPLLGVQAQEQDLEQEWLEYVHAALVRASSLTTQRTITAGHVILTYRLSLSDDMPVSTLRGYLRFSDDSRQQFERGSTIMQISDIMIELGTKENPSEVDEETVTWPEDTSSLMLQKTTVEGQTCYTNAITEGAMATGLLLEINDSLQGVQSQLEQYDYLIQSIINDPEGWIIDLVELPTEHTGKQELRVFSFSLDPEQYITYLLTTGEMIPPELSQIEDLIDQFFEDVYESFQYEWKIWIDVANGYIYREMQQSSLVGAMDGLDRPDFGIWLEIGATGNIEISHSDHNQLSDADFVFSCEPQ